VSLVLLAAIGAVVAVVLVVVLVAFRHRLRAWAYRPVPAFQVIRNGHVVAFAVAFAVPGIVAMSVDYLAGERDKKLAREQFAAEIRDIQRNELTRDQVSQAVRRIVKLEAPSEGDILRIVRRGIQACADNLAECPVREFVRVLNRVLSVDLQTGKVRPMPAPQRASPPTGNSTTTVVRPTTTVQETTTVTQPPPPADRGGQLDSDVLRGTDEKVAALEDLVQGLAADVAHVVSRVEVLDRLLDVLCRRLAICIR
jgi:hypothetical protein